MKREELKKQLKEDAQKTWDFLKQGVKTISKYGLLAIALNSPYTSSSQELQEIKDDYRTSLENHKKLENKLSLTSNYTINYEEIFNYLDYITQKEEKTPEKRAEETYTNIVDTIRVDNNITIQELIDGCGVTTEDIQQVFSKEKELLKEVIPGKVAKSIAKSADKVSGTNNGRCLYGAQMIFQKAGLGKILDGSNPDWNGTKLKGCSNNSACKAYIPLEKSGKFINVVLQNTAYNKAKNSEEDKELKAFCKTLPAGSIIINDNKIADEHLGRRYVELSNRYGDGGAIHGHITIKDNHGLYKEEGVALAPNFSNYGKDFRVSLSADSTLPKELTIKLLTAKEQRLDKEKDMNENNIKRDSVPIPYIYRQSYQNS